MNLSFIPKISPRSDEQRRADMERRLIQREAKIGGQLFGPVPNGHTRQFFCLDQHTWVWHEEWLNQGQRQAITTRYDVRANAIIKSQDGQPNRLVSPQEAQHLYKAVKLYKKRVLADYSHDLQAA